MSVSFTSGWFQALFDTPSYKTTINSEAVLIYQFVCIQIAAHNREAKLYRHQDKQYYISDTNHGYEKVNSKQSKMITKMYKLWGSFDLSIFMHSKCCSQ